MSDSSLIDTYLATLQAELRVSARRRERILQETKEHLRDTAALSMLAGVAPDQAQRDAIARFGASGVIAAEFAEACATDQACAAGTISIATLGGAFVFLQVQDAALPMHSLRLWNLYNPPLQLVIPFAVALTALLIALAAGCCALWWTRPARRESTTLERHVVVQVLCAAVASLTALAVSSLGDIIALVQRAGLDSGSPPVPLIALLAALQSATIALGAIMLLRARARFVALGPYDQLTLLG
jgi:hypothetical protein